jgi:hypothetical protein
MPHGKNSATRIAAAERRTRALQLRVEGRTYAAIGKELGCSEQRAHRNITKELARLNARRAEAAGEVTRLELERLDALWAGLWAKAKGGDDQGVAAALAVMARRAGLLGLDKPAKFAATDPSGDKPAQPAPDYGRLNDAELLTLKALLDKAHGTPPAPPPEAGAATGTGPRTGGEASPAAGG